MAIDLRFAVLIDADNIAEKYINLILDEVSKEGVATYKRIYADWTSPALASWKSTLLNHSILPIQQYSYTIGKNATDSAMIIDAMDILYSGQVNGFCIVSSDSDFTRLAARLRESGMQVIGMGERKTPKPFISACNQFKYLDILWMNAAKLLDKNAAVATTTKPPKSKVKKEAGIQSASDELNLVTGIETIKAAIQTIVEESSDEDGWIFLSQVRILLGKRYPDFDVRNFEFSKFLPFIESFNAYEVKREPKGNIQLVYIRKQQSKS